MSSFQKAIDEALRMSAQPGAEPMRPQSAPQMSFQDAIDSIVQTQLSEAPGATPGTAPGEADLLEGAAKQYEDLLITPEGGIGMTGSGGILPLREIERGLRMTAEQAAQTIATPGMRGQFIRSLMRPSEYIASWFSDVDPAMHNFVAQAFADKLSMAVEPEKSGLTVEDLRSELIAMRGAQQGMMRGAPEGVIPDVARAVGQNVPQMIGVAGALATGNVPVAAGIISTAMSPFTSYSSGFIEAMDEVDQQRADDAIEGRPLTEYSLQESRTRAEARAVIEAGVEAGGAAIGGKALAMIAGVGLNTKVGKAALRPFIERGAPIVNKALQSKAGQKGLDTFARISNGTASFRNGWLGRASGIIGVSGLEEGAEEGITAALMAPFTAAPLSKDLADGVYGAFIGTIAGGIGGTGSVLAVSGNRALMNRREAMRPETDHERALRTIHGDALKRRVNWQDGLDQTQIASVSSALDSLNGMDQQQRGVFLADLAQRQADIQTEVESMLDERQRLDIGLAGAMDAMDAQAIQDIKDDIARIDASIGSAVTDRLMASAIHNAVAEKISEMPAVMEQADPATVLSGMGTRAGMTMTETTAPKSGKRVQKQIEALGRKVVWFRPSGKFNPAFHSMRSRGVVYLNADAKPDRIMASALEEVFHDIQMFQPELAEVFMERAGLAPIYAAGVEYAGRGAPESAATGRMDLAAMEQAGAALGALEGVQQAPIAPGVARAGAARLEQEGAANAFAAAAAATRGGIFGPAVAFAAARGFLGREAMAAMAVFETVARAAAVSNVVGPKVQDPSLSPLARTLLWAGNMDVNFARDIETARKFVAKQAAERVGKVIATKREKAEAAARKAQVGDIQKSTAVAKLREALVGQPNMREGARLDMARRFMAAAASMATLNFRPLTPSEYLQGHKRNKATQTLTQYTLDQIANPTIETNETGTTRTSYEPYGIPGLDVAYMIKRVESLDSEGKRIGGYDEAVGLYSNETDITDVIAPVMLHAISRYPNTEMRCDCYDVRRPGQAEQNGKLPTAYRMFGFVADEQAMPNGYAQFDPQYLTPPSGMTLDEYIDLLSKYWKSEGWVPETDANGRVTNYPGVWFAKLNLSESERERIRSTGLAGFTADPSRLERIAAGRGERDAVVGVSVDGEGRPSPRVEQVDAAGGARDDQGDRRNPSADSDIFVGSARRISLVKLTLALKRELDTLTPDSKGRLLSASQWLPAAVKVDPEAAEAERMAAIPVIADAMARVRSSERAVAEAQDAIEAERKRLRAELRRKDASPAELAQTQASIVRLNQGRDIASLAETASYMTAEIGTIVAITNERARIVAKRESLRQYSKLKGAYAKDDVDQSAEARLVRLADAADAKDRIAALTERIRDIDQQVSSWVSGDPLVQALMQAQEDLAESTSALADAKANTFGDILADKGIMSYRMAGSRKYTVGELQVLLDSFSQSIMGWLTEYTQANPIPKQVEQIMVRSIADDLKYAATKAGSASALEWYGRLVDQMWSEASRRYPELAKKTSDDRRVFALMLAITSQGERVSNNALLTRALYEAWVSAGRDRIVIPPSFDARHVGPMIGNLNKLNVLRETLGSWKAVEKFMLTKAKVRQHNKTLREMNLLSENGKVVLINDAADDIVYMSSVLGPKIGSFFNNLYKRFDTLTADVWFTRTFMRPLGMLRRQDDTAIRSAIADVAQELAKARAIVAAGNPDAVGFAEAEQVLRRIPANVLENPALLDQVATNFDVEFAKDVRNRVVVGTSLKLRKKSPLEAALVRYAKALSASAAAPESNYIRTQMRSILTQAIDVVKNETGLQYEVADAQAALWYVEKELYAMFGAADDPVGQDYRVAMREAMSVDLGTSSAQAQLRSALAENDLDATVADGADAGVVAEPQSESFAREEAQDAEVRKTKAAIEAELRWAAESGFTLESFAREPSDELKALVASGDAKFIGSPNPTNPVMLYHATDEVKFSPYRSETGKLLRGLSLSTVDTDELKVFGKYIHAYYVIATNPLRVECHGASWDNIPSSALPLDIRDELEYVAISTDKVQQVALANGYDVVHFVGVNDDVGTHDEIVVSGRRNLISPFTGETLEQMDFAEMRVGNVPPLAALSGSSPLGGSTGATLQTAPTGERWVVKGDLGNANFGRNELQYFNAYRFFGLPVPDHGMDVRVGTPDLNRVLITRYAEGYQTIGQFRKEMGQRAFEKSLTYSDLGEHIVLHALARNWDVIGMDGDNTLVDPDTGNVLYVDLGGTGGYRAQGEAKPYITGPWWFTQLQTLVEYNPDYFYMPPNGAIITDVLTYFKGIAENRAAPEEERVNLPGDLQEHVRTVAAWLLGVSGMTNTLELSNILFQNRDEASIERIYEHAGKRLDALRNSTNTFATWQRMTFESIRALVSDGRVAPSSIRELIPDEALDFRTNQDAYAAGIAALRTAMIEREQSGEVNVALLPRFVDAYMRVSGNTEPEMVLSKVLGDTDARLIGYLINAHDGFIASMRNEERPSSSAYGNYAKLVKIPGTSVVEQVFGTATPVGAGPSATESMARDPDASDAERDALRSQISDMQRTMRDLENTTAAQRTNAMREVRVLQRRLSFAELVASRKEGQAQRLKARLERVKAINDAERIAASETASAAAKKLEEARARVVRLREEMRDRKSETREAIEALAEAEDRVDRIANWAYAIGRNEGLVAGQVFGMQKERNAAKPFRERVAVLEARVAQAESALRAATHRIKVDAKASARAIDFAHQMGLRAGQVQGMMRGRQQILKKMQQREDTLQRQIFAIKTMLQKSRNVLAVQRAARRIAMDAAMMLPRNLRGPLATRIANATTIAKANRVAVEATKLAVNEEVRQQLRVISALRKRMNKRGMRWDVRQAIERLLTKADANLRQANRRRIYATVATVPGMGSAVVNAVNIYAQVLDSANDVQAALLLYEQDRASFVAGQQQRVARYNDLKTRLATAMTGRQTLPMRDRADLPPRQSLARRISIANSDIYTLMLEVEGTMGGVINEMLVGAQDAKGEAGLEHARIVNSLGTALRAAGYAGIEDYALRNGLNGTSIAETMDVVLEGRTRTIPVGLAMSIAAMDDETLELFIPPTAPDAARQGLQFAGAETTLTVFPTDAEIRAIRAGLTAGQRGLIDAMKDVLEVQIRDRAMEAVFLVEGDQPPVITNYWPRVRNMDEFQGESKSVLNQHGSLVRSALTSVGFTNAREGGRQPLIYRDAFQTWERHLHVALDMIHMAQPYRDASTVLTDPDIVAAIDRQMGRNTAEAILAIFSNGVGATARASTNAIDRMTNNVTGAVLSLSPRTAAKVVVGGTIRLGSEIPGNYWVEGLSRAAIRLRSPSAWAARVDEIHSASGYFTRRHQMQMRGIVSGTLSAGDRVKVMTAAKGMARAFAAAGHAAIAKNITDSLNALGDATDNANLTLTALIDMLRLMDEHIMSVAVEARLAEAKDEGLTGTDAFEQAVKRAERDFRLTQNASDEFDETAFAAVNRVRGSGATWRMLFVFSSDPLKARNQIRRAWLSGERRIGTALAISGNTASSTIIGVASVATVAYMAKTIAALFGGADEPDDEEDKAFAEAVKSVPASVAAELIGSTFGYVGLGFSTALQSIVNRRAMGQAIVVRPIEQAAREMQADREWYYNAVPALLALGQLRGVPVYQLYRFVAQQIPEEEKGKERTVQEAVDRLRMRYSPDEIRKRIREQAARRTVPRIP
jgi:hypothetical protein